MYSLVVIESSCVIRCITTEITLFNQFFHNFAPYCISIIESKGAECVDEKLLAYNLSSQQLIDNWLVAFHPVSTMYITEYNAEYNVHSSNGKSQFISIE